MTTATLLQKNILRMQDEEDENIYEDEMNEKDPFSDDELEEGDLGEGDEDLGLGYEDEEWPEVE